MIYDLGNEAEKINCLNRFSFLQKKNKIVELKEVTNKRSSLANAALHLFFTHIAEILNEMGLTYCPDMQISGFENIETPFNKDIIKEKWWRPIQICLYDIESTTELDSEMITTISEVIIKHFAEKGIYLMFPSKYTQWLKEQEEKEKGG